MIESRRPHPAWIVLGALAVCMLASSGLRAVFGVYIKPMEAEFGWSRSALSGAAAVSLLFLGAVGPLAGRLADRWGPRRVIGISLILLAAGAIGSAFIQSLWQLYLITAIVMAVGAGGVNMSTGAAVVARWFEAKRGIVMGLVGGAMSAGQLVVIPLAAALTFWFGWRTSYLTFGGALLLLILPVAILFIRNDPEERGGRPYGASGPLATAAQAAAAAKAGRVSLTEAARFPQFWLLMATFFVCGYTSSGIVLVHFMPHAIEHNFSEFQAATALGVIGAMNIVGTIGSGWLCDRFGRRGPLATYYFIRGVSLLYLLYVHDVPSLHLWAALFGLNWISTVPPTTTLTANIFGRFSVGELSGWIYFSHQVGSALGAALAGWLYEWAGNYNAAFVSAAFLAFLATGMAMAIREEPIRARPTPSATPEPVVS
jgi:MFS family permease